MARERTSIKPVERKKSSSSEESVNSDVLDIFRRNFEAHFGSIDHMPVRSKESIEDIAEKDSDSEDSFRGFSDEESCSDEKSSGEDSPVVVKFSDRKADDDSMSQLAKKQQKKLFISSKAPKFESTAATVSKPAKPESIEDLKNDLELNRLIKESHILAEAERHGHFTGADISLDAEFNPKAKLKVLEMRLDEIGSKKKTESIPMHICKGIVNRKQEKQAKYEQYAKEAGIVLAWPTKTSKKAVQRRERGLQIQTVGRSTKHGHIISAKEIEERSAKRQKRAKARR